MEGRLLVLQLLFFTIQHVGSQNSGFIEQPTTVESLPVVDARFYCKHLSADIIDWSVNGTLLTVDHPSNIVAISTSINGEQLHQLIIQASSDTQYNDTSIRCVAIFLDVFPPREVMTPPAKLIILANTTADQIKRVISADPDGFLETPMPLEQNLVIGEQPQYRCRPCEADYIRWIINGTLIGNNFPAGFSGSYTIQTNNRTQLCSQRLLFTLRVTDLSLYNNTIILCAAISVSSSREMPTSPSRFKVQGKLGGVTNLVRITTNSSTESDLENVMFGWDPPFSLDLTNADPDIVYNVYVYDITCEEAILVYHNRELTRNYTKLNVTLSSDKRYNVSVTAQSYIAQANNGPPTEVNLTEKFIFFERSTTTNRVTRITNDMSIIVEIEEVTQQHIIKPQNLLISLKDTNKQLNNRLQEVICPAVNVNNSDVSLMLDVYCNDSVQTRKLFKSRIMHQAECELQILSEDLELSTYDIQNISVIATDQPGEVVMTFDLIHDGTALGLLVIAYSDSDTDVHLIVANSRPRTQLNLTGLHNDTYTFSVFCIEDDGLPLNSTAALPRRVSNITGTQEESRNNPDDGSQILIDEEKDCISCHFPDNGSSCVAIVFMKASRLHLSEPLAGLLHIEVHQVTHQLESGENLICSVDLDLSNYSIAVFRYDNSSRFLANKPSKVFYSKKDLPECNDKTLWCSQIDNNLNHHLIGAIGSTVTCAIIIILLALALMLAIIVQHRKKKSKGPGQKIPDSETEEDTDSVQTSTHVHANIMQILKGSNAELDVDMIFSQIKSAAPKWKEIGAYLSDPYCNLLECVGKDASEEECLRQILEAYDQKHSTHNGQIKLNKIVEALERCGEWQLASMDTFNFFAIPGTPSYGSRSDINTITCV